MAFAVDLDMDNTVDIVDKDLELVDAVDVGLAVVVAEIAEQASSGIDSKLALVAFAVVVAQASC